MSELLPTSSPTTDTIVLMMTADMTGGRDKELQRLVRSVAAFKQARPTTVVYHHMLLQRCDSAAAAKAELGFPDDMIVTAVPQQLPLSKARNQMLDTVLADGAAIDDALIAFPDDDAWFPERSLEYIHDSFRTDPELDFLFCEYGTDAAMPQHVDAITPGLQQAISSASSNTIFVRGSVLRKIGGFDEGLGLGTPAKSGEDTEFGIRAYLASRKVRFVPHKIIGHRDFDNTIRAKYYGGTLVALGRHATHTTATRTVFARKILVGLALIGKRDLTPGGLTNAWKMFAANRAAPNLASVTKRASGINLPGKSGHKDSIHA